MRGLARAIAAGAMIAGLSAAASAQEDLERGKSGAQIFATDCAICHKSAPALVKKGAPNEGFLRAHYTSSREMAAAVAAYLRTVAKSGPGASSKGKPRAKAGEGKAGPKAEPSSSPGLSGDPDYSGNAAPS